MAELGRLKPSGPSEFPSGHLRVELFLPHFLSGIGEGTGAIMLTKDHIDTLVLIVVACALGATVWYYASERSAAEQAPPKEYVVCVLDEDKNPTDCVPYDDFVSEDAPSRSKRIVNR